MNSIESLRHNVCHLCKYVNFCVKLCKKKLHSNVFLCKGRAMMPYYEIHKKQTNPQRQDPDYFEKAAAALPLDDFYIDALKNLYQEKLSAERDVNMRGDDKMIGKDKSAWLPNIDLDLPRLSYHNVHVLQTAPESVKKIFSIRYGIRRDLTSSWKQALIDRVKLHNFDKSSIEMKIAWLTVLIRHWCLLLDEINNKPRKPGWLTNRINLAVLMRRKLLRKLRETNMASFERILNELQIAYKVPILPEQMIERRQKAWTEAMLDSRFEQVKMKKLEELHEKYIKERNLKEKEMDARSEEIKTRIEAIGKRIKEIQLYEMGVDNEIRTYQPNLIDCISERTIHAALFYHSKPQKL